MELVTPTHQRTDQGYLSCVGRGITLTVSARCSCGWAGPTRPWGPGAIADEQADLDAHHHVSGHRPLNPAATQLHRCGHVHGNLDDCAVPYDSPAGQLIRASQATLARPDAAVDRLAAATALSVWASQQQDEAVVGAYLAGLGIRQIATSAGLSIDHVTARWGRLLDRLQTARLIDPLRR